MIYFKYVQNTTFEVLSDDFLLRKLPQNYKIVVLRFYKNPNDRFFTHNNLATQAALKVNFAGPPHKSL